MVSTCCVINCKNRYKKGVKLRLFRFPFTRPIRFGVWVKNLNRRTASGEVWKPKHYDRVCSDHFIEGQPVDDPLHPDYAPNINMGYERKVVTLNRWKSRQKREEIMKVKVSGKFDNEAVAGAMALQTLSVKNLSNEDIQTEEPTSSKNENSEELPKGSECAEGPVFSSNTAAALIQQLVKKHQVSSDTGSDTESCQSDKSEENITDPSCRPRYSVIESSDSANDPENFVQSDSVNLEGKQENNLSSSWVDNRKRSRLKNSESQLPKKKKSTLLPSKYTPSGISDSSAFKTITPQQSIQNSSPGFPSQDVQVRMLEMKVKSLENEADLVKTMRDYYKEQVTSLQLLTKQLKMKADERKFSFQKAKENCQLYTGVTPEMFEFFLSEIDSEVFKRFCGISKEDILLLTLMRLKLNLPPQELALRFNLTKGSVLRYLEAIIPILRLTLEKHLTWPNRDDCLSKLPCCFKMSKLSGVNCVIGCLELTLKVHKVLDSYRDNNKLKNQDSVKFLIATTPNGEVTYISPGKGGKSSDLDLTLEFLSKQKSKDEILTECKIPTVQNECSLSLGSVKVHCPNTNSGDSSSEEMKRLHRKSWGATIDRMQNFSILSSRCPFGIVKYLDDIVLIIASIINLQKMTEDKKPLGKQKKKRCEEIDCDLQGNELDEQIDTSEKVTNSEKSVNEIQLGIDEDWGSDIVTVMVENEDQSINTSLDNDEGDTLLVTKNEEDGTLTIKNEKDGSVTVVSLCGENQSIINEIGIKNDSEGNDPSVEQVVLTVNNENSQSDIGVIQQPLNSGIVSNDDTNYLLQQIRLRN